MEKQLEQQELKDIIASREDGFGHLFKIARDEKNMSIDDVARELHLDKKIILALESEDHTQLPVAAFVCGYIRNYAKLLNIQPDPLVEYYKKDRNEETLEPELKIRKEKESPGQSRVSSSLSAIVMPVFTVLIILALLAGGWQVWLYVSNNYLGKSSDTFELEAPGFDDKENIGDEQNDTDTLLLPELNESYEPPAEELMEESALPVESSSLAEGSSPAPAESSPSVEASLTAVSNNSEFIEGVQVIQGPQQAGDSLQIDDSLQVDSQPVNDSSTTVAAVQNNLEALPVRVVKNQLILEFSGNSWISIKDASNKILATGLKKSPKLLQLDGKMPYQVFLGDARVVKVSINGKIFDHSKFINEKNVARFNVK